MRKFLLIFMVFISAIGIFTACGNENEKEVNDTGSVYFLNFKPEAETAYREVAEKFTSETGIPVKIVTASAGNYEQTLASEITKSESPTIFQVNGPVGFENWKEYCSDLKESGLYRILSDKSLAITDGEGVYAIPYAMEGYGILYNDGIMQKYFNTKNPVVNSINEIKDYGVFKAVVEDMTSKKDELGIEGVFASTSMAAGEQWRWTTHLANIPFYYEFKEKSGDNSPANYGLTAEKVDFKYGDNFKNLFDLYINNSITQPSLLGGKTSADSLSEFALEKVAMMQNGNWVISQISDIKEKKINEEDIKILPIYMGIEGEENSGVCIGTENYLAINSEASESDRKASIEFLEWLFSSEEGKKLVVDKLGFILPFENSEKLDTLSDSPEEEIVRRISSEDINSVPWVFTSFPSQEFKNSFGDSLLQYAQGTKKWDDVKNTVTEKWEQEYSLRKK